MSDSRPGSARASQGAKAATEPVEHNPTERHWAAVKLAAAYRGRIARKQVRRKEQ